MSLAIKRIYEPAAKTDGFLLLVDRLWPRGISKTTALLYSARDERFNQAEALKGF
jgi:uncharacterized protein YeaO (DUF488 family)